MREVATIQAEWRTARLMKYLRHLHGERLNQALSVAVNDTARQVERQAERLVAKELSIKAKRARQGIFIRPVSTPKTLSATIRGSNSEIPLKAFNAREQGSGVTARIWGKRQFHAGAFIFGGRGANRGADLGMGGHVFYRKGRTWIAKGKRGPISKAKGASIGEAMAKAAIATAIERHAEERLQANVLRQFDRYTRRARGKFK